MQCACRQPGRMRHIHIESRCFVTANPCPFPSTRSTLMNYLAVKHVHMTCVAESGMLFLLRGVWMMRESPMLQRRWVKIVPHVIDTLLLASAITFVVWCCLFLFVLVWLLAKELGLIVYILLGAIARKRGRTKRIRIVAFAAAVAVFLYIVRIAFTRQVF